MIETNETRALITNNEKKQVYAILKAKLKIAMEQEFYLEYCCLNTPSRRTDGFLFESILD